MRSVKELSLSPLRVVASQESETGGNDRRDISQGQKGKLRNNEHLNNRSSISQPWEGLHEDMVLTKQESCQ